MKGIDFVIKNQKGEVSDFEDDHNNRLRFRCPICGNMESVRLNCPGSVRAFKTIRYHPHTQLICYSCQDRIALLNWWYNNRRKNGMILEQIYEKLNWR